MLDELILMEMYPRHWQSSLSRSMHPLLLHTTLWYYWLVFTFNVALGLFFIYLYKALTYQRADIRGTRATGEKRRIAWPEMLIVILPFYWAINIVINALSYLRTIEGSNGHVLLSVQVTGYQWGWKYCYNDTTYLKILHNPIKFGNDQTEVYSDSNELIHRNVDWLMREQTKWKLVEYTYEIEGEMHEKLVYEVDVEATEKLRWDLGVFDKNNADISRENYFCRYWLKYFDKIENELNNKTLNKKWHDSYWINSQGVEPNTTVYDEKLLQNNKIIYNNIKDPLRLLRATGALVLPTKNPIRLMGCSDDITHSWAVPALGIKMDCVPGRLFNVYLNIQREGIYYGQCSELCGWNHYNMPIVLYALPVEHFIIWWEIQFHHVYHRRYYNYNIEIDISFEDYISYDLIDVKFK